jgi:hypothetical protein
LAERVVHENAAIDLVALPASEDDLTLAGLASIAGADLVLTDPASNALARRFARRDAEMGMSTTLTGILSTRFVFKNMS